MLTAVVSDLHLGSLSSVLATPAARDRLLGELEAADQVVLLGDVLSLREAPANGIFDAARPFFEGLGDALGDRRVVIVPGNHDHRLVEPLLEARPLDRTSQTLEVTWPVDGRASGLLGALARLMPKSEVVVAYPGVWVRPDVYATHGHYLDCHMTVPRLECLAAHVMTVAVGGLGGRNLAAADYEAALAPLYAFAYSRAQAAERTAGTSSAPPFTVARRLQAHGWTRLAGRDGRRRPHRRAAAGLAALAVVAALNRAGLGPFKAALSSAEIGRAGVRAMAEVVARLGIRADHVIFGHIHRAGPIGEENAWALPDGTRLFNTGSWVYEPALIGDGGFRDPYWPGMSVLVPEQGAPALRPLLAERSLSGGG